MSAGSCTPAGLAAPSLASGSPHSGACPAAKLPGLRPRCYVCSLICVVCIFIGKLAFGHVTLKRLHFCSFYYTLDNRVLWDCTLVLYWEALGELGFEFWKSSRAVFWKPPSFILKSVSPPPLSSGGWLGGGCGCGREWGERSGRALLPKGRGWRRGSAVCGQCLECTCPCVFRAPVGPAVVPAVGPEGGSGGWTPREACSMCRACTLMMVEFHK